MSTFHVLIIVLEDHELEFIYRLQPFKLVLVVEIQFQ